jgi:hypothetical protein
LRRLRRFPEMREAQSIKYANDILKVEHAINELGITAGK